MAILPIIKEGDPVLRLKAKPVGKVTKRVRKLIRDMAQTMYDAPGVGLAAPQVGISERIIVIDIGEGLIALINPEITDVSGSERDVEGCLSVPGVSGYVTRAAKVGVTGSDENGKPVKYEGTGFLARAFQHEIDHLNGVLFIDYLKDKPETGDDH
jgi:peptide deformylase